MIKTLTGDLWWVSNSCAMWWPPTPIATPSLFALLKDTPLCVLALNIGTWRKSRGAKCPLWTSFIDSWAGLNRSLQACQGCPLPQRHDLSTYFYSYMLLLDFNDWQSLWWTRWVCIEFSHHQFVSRSNQTSWLPLTVVLKKNSKYYMLWFSVLFVNLHLNTKTEKDISLQYGSKWSCNHDFSR